MRPIHLTFEFERSRLWSEEQLQNAPSKMFMRFLSLKLNSDNSIQLENAYKSIMASEWLEENEKDLRLSQPVKLHSETLELYPETDVSLVQPLKLRG